MEEIWKAVVGFEGLYEVSNLGKVRSLHWYGGDKIVERALVDRPDGYKSICLSKNGKSKIHLIHRLVAEAFLPKIEGKDFVNHKDENRSNNRVENLEWCNKSYNQLYSMALHPERKDLFIDNLRDKKTGKIGSRFTQKGVAHTNFQKVKQCLRDGTIIAVYDNPSIAALKTGADIGNLISACKANARTDRKRKRKYKCSSHGFVWMFA
ncbi:MAG: NUMOD4 motif-containing HNH endonuclease [Lachnospiraceae bacterium]|nr:NUMOD4 motif-containing HNH endonuclease [Lachnospiraceae bacterium]